MNLESQKNYKQSVEYLKSIICENITYMTLYDKIKAVIKIIILKTHEKYVIIMYK